MQSKYEKQGFVKIKERFPYKGKGFDELLQTLKRLFDDPSNKYLQKLTLNVADPFISLEKMVREDEAESVPKLSLHDAIRNSSMEEYIPEKKQTGMQDLWDIFSIIRKEGLEVGILAAGDKFMLQGWLGVRIPTTDLSIFGVPIKLLSELPEETLIVCGTEKKDAEVEDIRFCLKVNLS